jgi:hypothetical protein
MGQKGPFWDNYATAQITLDGDLGRFEDRAPFIYDLDDAARDRLIVHARQDAAHALLNTSTMLGQLAWVRRGVWLVAGLLVLCALMLAGR